MHLNGVFEAMLPPRNRKGSCMPTYLVAAGCYPSHPCCHAAHLHVLSELYTVLWFVCQQCTPAALQAELISVDGNRVKKFDVKAEDDASALGKRVSEATLQVRHRYRNRETTEIEKEAGSTNIYRQPYASSC